MHTIKAIFDGTNFKLLQPIPVKEVYEVFITFVEPFTKAESENQSGKLPRSTALGLWRNKVCMSDDFNEPIEEMKAYME